MFDDLEATTRDVLDRHAAPAMSLGELRELIARERPGFTPPPISLAAVLKRTDGSIRILSTDPLRLGWMVPVGWVVPPPGKPYPRTLVELLRQSLRQLGHRIEPGSSLALARWARLLREEERVRPELERLAKAAADLDGHLRPGQPTHTSGGHPTTRGGTNPRAPGPDAEPDRSTTRPPYPRPSRRTRSAGGPPAWTPPRTGGSPTR